jgi:predicted O-linked N-acetylglucosamine transferase (SPINDLY family)
LPGHDEVFARIARKLGDSQFVFVPYRAGTSVTQVFQQRLRQAFAAFGMNPADHCVFLPRLDRDRFAAASGQCDVFLDSIGWSGCNTTLESLAHDLPIVTLRGDLMRARHSAAILERMGIADTIAGTIDDFIAAAVRLGRDVPWRNQIKERIAANKHRIYRDRATIGALEEFLDRAVRGRKTADSSG